MIASRFRSVWLVAAVAVAALLCYLVSQRVAGERAKLAAVERRIAVANRDIRHLRMEIVTRSRMPQLERWNDAVLGLTAPEVGQFMDSEVRLASLNQKPLPLDPAIVASHGAVRTVAYAPGEATPAAPAPAPDAAQAPEAAPLLRQATYLRPKASGITQAPIRVALAHDEAAAPVGAARRPERAEDRPAKKATDEARPAKLAARDREPVRKDAAEKGKPERIAAADKPKADRKADTKADRAGPAGEKSARLADRKSDASSEARSSGSKSAAKSADTKSADAKSAARSADRAPRKETASADKASITKARKADAKAERPVRVAMADGERASPARPGAKRDAR